VSNGDAAPVVEVSKKQKAVDAPSSTPAKPTSSTESIQAIVGFYDGVLHGFTATISPSSSESGKSKSATVEFADTFLLTAHTKAIRCLAVSPPSAPVPGQPQKVILASGSNDSKINLYDLSAHPPKEEDQDPLKHVAPRPILENRRNRELGNLEHHASAVTSLQFPSRSKLMSGSEDSTIAVTRTRDWALIGNIKAPIAKAEGRPTGDTAAHDGTPQGVNDFAVHPSMKLMMSVSKGERKVRPWNLMTGKRAKALNYQRDLLSQIGEGRHASGEGKKIVWGSVDGADEFAVGFDRDVVVFGMEGDVKCRIMEEARTKIHQVSYFSIGEDDSTTLLALSTEDGRIIISSTKSEHLRPIANAKGNMAPATAKTIGQVGGKEAGVTSRIKDFIIVRSSGTLYILGGSSDGNIRLWSVAEKALQRACEGSGSSSNGKTAEGKGGEIGALIGTYKTDNRVTSMTGYLMIPSPDGADEDDFEGFGSEAEAKDEEEDSSSSDEDDN